MKNTNTNNSECECEELTRFEKILMVFSIVGTPIMMLAIGYIVGKQA